MRVTLATLASLLLIVPVANGRQTDSQSGGSHDALVIRNARIVLHPKRTLASGAILIEGETITAVGADLDIPEYAEVLDASGLTVYPGLIAGPAFVADPNESAIRADDQPASPIQDRMERSRQAPLEPDGLRRVGLTVVLDAASHTGFPAPCRPILLTSPKRDSVHLPTGTRILMGQEPRAAENAETWRAVAARWRASTEPAGRAREASEAENSDSKPASTDTLVLFVARNDVEVRRVLELGDELGIRVGITQLEEGNHASPLVRAAANRNGPIPLFVALALPARGTADLPSDSVWSRASEEFASLEERRSNAGVEREKVALLLRRRDLPFGFSMVDVEPDDLLPSIRRMVAAGLSSEDALAALTTGPAHLLGIDDVVGTIEPSKLANLVVTDGALLDASTSIRYVFVAGERFDMALPKPEAGRSPGAPVAEQGWVGTWRYRIRGSAGTLSGTLRFENGRNGLRGWFGTSSSDEPQPIQVLASDPSLLHFRAQVPTEGGSLTLEIQAGLEDGELRGTAEIGRFGTFPFEAGRAPGQQ